MSELKHHIVSDVVSGLTNSNLPMMSTKGSEELLTPKELWTALKISESHFYKIKKQHKNFPYYNFDGTKRYKLSEVEDFFKINKQ